MTTTAPSPRRPEAEPLRRQGGKRPFFVAFYRSAVGKKWVMAVTGLMLMGFVLVHMIGNFKIFISKEEMNLYGEALRDLGGHLVPRTSLLWIMRIGLVAAFAFHIHAAVSLTRLNRAARPDRYQSPRDYAAVTFASRTTRWTGTIIALFVLFHLADLTWGSANSEFLRGDPYNNLVYSMERPIVAAIYIVASLTLCIHLLHGAWSLFQSLGWTSPRFNLWRRLFAAGFAIVMLGNVAFPIAVQAGVLEPECPNAPPELTCEEAAELGLSEELDR